MLTFNLKKEWFEKKGGDRAMKIPVFHILMSIHPEYAEKILSGEKIFEFRKIIAGAFINRKIFIYETKPISKVVGTVDVEDVIFYQNSQFDEFWKRTKNGAGIEKEKLEKYFGGKNLYAYKLKNPVRFKEPLALSDFGVKRAPQSFIYLNGGKPAWEEK